MLSSNWMFLILHFHFNIPFYGFLQRRQLTDGKLLKVAEKLTKESDIYRLGFNLGLKHAEIQASIKNNRDEITMAAYHMLRAWMVQYQDRNQAFDLLVTALGVAKLQRIADDVLY